MTKAGTSQSLIGVEKEVSTVPKKRGEQSYMYAKGKPGIVNWFVEAQHMAEF